MPVVLPGAMRNRRALEALLQVDAPSAASTSPDATRGLLARLERSPSGTLDPQGSRRCCATVALG